mgnify:CR=1 FL=1
MVTWHTKLLLNVLRDWQGKLMGNNKEDSADLMDKFSRKASAGKYRVMGYDQYDYNDYFIAEFGDLVQAKNLLKEKASIANGIPTSFSDVYYIYDDKENMLYKGSYDEGIKNS